MGVVKKIEWKERTDRFGNPKLECYNRGRLIGRITYRPENIGKPWQAFVPGGTKWELYYFSIKEDAMDFVTRSIQTDSPSSKYSLKQSYPEYIESKTMGVEGDVKQW